MKEKVSNLSILTKGLIKENPVLVLLLGTCPTLAVTSMAMNGLGMGLATTFVLIGSNIVISLLKNFIPKEVRLPSFIVIIAGFVTVVLIEELKMSSMNPHCHLLCRFHLGRTQTPVTENETQLAPGV